MNYREIHKGYLKAILEQIQFDGKTLPVYTKRIIAPNLPYIFITSAKSGYLDDDMIDSGYYMRKLSYNLNLVLAYSEDITEDNISDDAMDALEQLIMSKFEEDAVRDCAIAGGVNPWTNLNSGQSTEPMAGESIGLTAGYTIKQFTIEIWQQVLRG